LTVPIDGPSAFAAAARRLPDKLGLRDRLASAARKRAVEEFAHVTMAERSFEVYRRVLAEPTPPTMPGERVMSPLTLVPEFDFCRYFGFP
jgi:hypothetical protein